MAEDTSSVAITTNDGVTQETKSVSPTYLACPVKFNGSNYLAWSNAFMMTIRANELVGYLNGKTVCPMDEAGKDRWLSKDALVMTWLIHSLESVIASQYLLLNSSKAIWDMIARQYSQKNNFAQAYEIMQQIIELKQGELSLTVFYSTLTHLWQQLDAFRTFQPSIPEELLAFQKDIERERVYFFLGKLRQEFDPIRVQVLGRNPFPSLEEAYFLLQHEERRRNTMMPSFTHERSALALSSRPSSKATNVPSELKSTTSERPPVECDYCGKPRHTRETCWKLHGRPSKGRGSGSGSGGGGRFSSRSQAHLSDASDTVDNGPPVALSPADILAFQRMLSQHRPYTDNSSTGSSAGNPISNIAQSGAG